jgi:hypothetical protein
MRTDSELVKLYVEAKSWLWEGEWWRSIDPYYYPPCQEDIDLVLEEYVEKFGGVSDAEHRRLAWLIGRHVLAPFN